MSRGLSIVSFQGFLVSLFMESLVLTIMYVFSFFLVFKLFKYGVKIIHLILDHLICLGSVDIKGYLVVAYF